MASIPVVKEDVSISSTNDNSAHHYDVIIIGAGFSGISNLHRLRGDGMQCHVFEAGMYK
jgi:cation diffusion facilitator CzcD-associated flavoprotein CzcO